MELSIKENGTLRPIKKIEEVCRYGLMAQDMTDSGSMVKLKDMVGLCTLRAMSMKVIGLRIKHMDMESILITTVRNSQVIGSLISNKAMEKNNGQTALSTKVTTKKE